MELASARRSAHRPSRLNRGLQTTLTRYQHAVSVQYDADGRISAEQNSASGQFMRRYVYGPAGDEPLLWYEGSGITDKRWFHADERGSVVAVSDSSGNALAINAYDEYGIPSTTNATYQGRFGFAGQAWLPELGMYYDKARIYSSTLGRFLQPDPVGYADGLNWYNYVGGDPVNSIDPTGTQEQQQYYTGSMIPGDVPAFLSIDGMSSDAYFATIGSALGSGFQWDSAGNDPASDVEAGKWIVDHGGYTQLTASGSYPVHVDLENFNASFSPQNAIQLSFVTTDLSNFPVKHWDGRWQLSRPSHAGGFVVQHIYSYSDKMNYWEAWHVSPGASVTDIFAASHTIDDHWQQWSGYGVANFYEGLTAPWSWLPGGDSHAGSLLSTDTDPA